MATKKIKKLLIFASLVIAVFAAAHFAMAAVDVGLDKAAGAGLSAANDPRVIAAKIIRIALGFLGLIAISLIIYAGWLWMTAAGEEEKIAQAKKILINAVIGLVIILSAFAIASFILSKLSDATGGPDGGNVCEPACSSGQYCCNSSCSNSPCGGGSPDGDFFNIRSTIPRNLDTKVIRNVVIKAFFNKSIGATVGQAVLDNNFKVEKIAVIDALTKVETAVSPVSVAGAISLTSDRKEINFKSNTACGDEKNTPNCLPEWSKFRVKVDGASGIISVNGQSLNCSAGSNCQFEFSTSDAIDTSGPGVGILPAQICKDDGTLDSIPNANLVNGWAKDDVGVADIRFCSEKKGGAENCLANSVKVGGLGQTYLSHSYKYDTSGYTVGDDYIFRAKASDLAGQIDKAEFSAKIRAGHCCNGVEDVNETDVDCGGECGACDGAACANDMSAPAVCSDSLCASQFCATQNSGQSSCEAAGYAAGTTACCLCQRPPVITAISPVGGFCADNLNKACLADSDCGVGVKCDANTANGAAGNFFTIYGKYFGVSPGKVFASDGAGGWIQAKLANDPAAGNAQCGNQVWTDSQIIAIVPAGAKTGIIKVENLSGLSGVSVPDFKINNITRPGICLLDPDSGKQDQVINYNGIKLSAASPYFGNLANKIAGVAPVFNDKDGTAKVPNLITGRTTSFVMKGKTVSNYLDFTKETDPYKGPFIASFDPHEGAAGQYVTINGGGFGNARGASKVYFGALGGAEANFNFPQICADSIWSDKQVIVKVPIGLANSNYKITMKIGSWPAIDTTAIQPAVDFKADSALLLKPSLCKIDPLIGKANSQINLYGEYFGQPDGNSKVRFQFNKDQAIFDYWDRDDNPKITGIRPDKIITKVLAQAVTGPVRAVKGDPELVGNGLNFTVGMCQNSVECGLGSLCCSAGTPYAGQCKVGAAEQEVCFPQIKACVYEWNFSTAGLSTCSSDQTKCGSSCCNTSDSCDASYDNSTGKCDDIICASGVITCGGQCCPGATACVNGACPVRCEVAQVKCNIPNSPSGASQFNCCNSGQCNQISGQCDSCPANRPDQCGDGSCCSDTSNCKDTDNNPATPTECADPLSCAGYGPGQCLVESYLCPNSPGKCSSNTGGSVIDTGVKCGDAECNKLGRCKDTDDKDLCSYNSSLNKCVKIADTCDLTGKINDINGQQVGLKCGLVDNKTVWHYDSRQTCVSGYTKSIDKNKCLGAACATCSAGFICQKDGSGGICATDINICPTDSSCSGDKCVKTTPASCECCCNKTENNPADDSNPACCSGLSCKDSCGAGGDFGLCTGCTVAGDQAASNAKCNCSGTSGKFCNMAGAGGLGTCLDCASLTKAEACSTEGAGSCCVDAMNKNACIGTDVATVKSPYPGDNNNYCSYYSCQTTATSAACNGPVASSTWPTYKTADCDAKCTAPPQFGQECSTYGSDKGQKTAEKTCDVSQCANFSCLNEDGSGPTVPNSCGTCCCDPKAAIDQCQRFINPKLSCLANKGSCSGGSRGLCCGCSKDNECGNDNTGCGSSGDRCCQPRPSVTNVAPADKATKICRNSLIQATFNKAMQINTFNTNVIVVADYELQPCPAGTQYLTAVYKPNIFARMKFWLAKIPLVNKLFASPIRALTGNFCTVNGTVSGSLSGDGKKTTLEFKPQKLLAADRRYYVIIKGETDLTDAVHNGVLSQDGIGMNPVNTEIFNGVNYQGKIWYFRTMAAQAANNGACEIDHAEITPINKLFQTNKNDVSDDILGDKFNTIDDSDLVYKAEARAKDGSILNSLDNVYSWSWNWISGSTDIFELPASELENNGNQRVVRAKSTATEGQSVITATATLSIGSGGPYPAETNGYLMVCANPWPPVKSDGTWAPFQENGLNCTVQTAICDNTNFELSYCRDAGGGTTADDLPAIYSDNTVIRGRSANLKCDDGTGSCVGINKGNACSDNTGKCDIDILKEFYFFREGEQSTAGEFTVSALSQGGGVLANWADTGAAGYKIYYGTVSGNYTNSVDAGASLTKEITGLTNGQKYYFALTSYNAKKVESDYTKLSDSVVPSDTEKPIEPAISRLVAKGNKVEVVWQDQSQGDAKRFKLFYGADGNNFGASVNISYNTNGTTTVSNLAAGVTYYFGLVAYDFYNNPSATSTVKSIVAGINLTAATNNITKQGETVALYWDKFAPADGQVVNEYIVNYGAEINSLSMSISTTTLPTAANPEIISGLTNGTKYYFAVKARSGVDSAYSNIIDITPADSWSPLTPKDLSGTPGTGKAIIAWKSNQDDTAIYKIYYGGVSGDLRAAITTDLNVCLAGSCSAEIDGLNIGAKYYFAITALDGYNNESNKSEEINLIIK